MKGGGGVGWGGGTRARRLVNNEKMDKFGLKFYHRMEAVWSFFGAAFSVFFFIFFILFYLDEV